MEKYNILFVDDDKRYAEPLLDRAFTDFGINLRHFENWEEALSELDDHFENYHAVIIDGKGKRTRESKPDDVSHVNLAISDLSERKGRGRYIPYAVLSKYLDVKEIIYSDFFEKGKDEEKLFNHLIERIRETSKEKIKIKYPEPFQCFEGIYLDKKYENLLINIVAIFKDERLNDPENLLFNPCRIILERVFEKINEVDERVLPYALLNFDDQRVGLSNCSKYLNGAHVTIWIDKKPKTYQRSKYLQEYISQQIQSIIGICHPASHEIQNNYSKYTFQSVLWAIFDVLIWLKSFIDQRS